jgi:excisionase family DNA binding protein
MPENTLLSITQIALRWGLDPRTVRSYAENGRLRAIRVGSMWAVPASEIARVEIYGLDQRQLMF